MPTEPERETFAQRRERGTLNPAVVAWLADFPVHDPDDEDCACVICVSVREDYEYWESRHPNGS